ncbi:MAG: DUF721 domain-containing protein [Phycisphaeraceae bacterium]|nr:DUF721 domain-containing protein [Phycisphaeraceae bacterium]
MDQNNELAQIDRLRAWRVRSPHLELADAFRRAGVEFQAVARTGQSLGQAWASFAPAGLGERATADRVSRGVLVVRVANGADQHEAARWLRSGGALELSRAAGVGIRRWRFEYGLPPRADRFDGS